MIEFFVTIVHSPFNCAFYLKRGAKEIEVVRKKEKKRKKRRGNIK